MNNEINNVFYEDIQDKIAEYLSDISSIISRSMGYYGATTILEDKMNGHVITKDGYTILNKIKVYNNSLKATILDLVKNISRDLVREVGDGSTSSVVIASQLFKSFVNLKKEDYYFRNLPTKIILEKLNRIEEIISKELLENSIEINEYNFDKLKEIAKISLNNDEEYANILYEIYKDIGKDGNIFIEKSPTEKTFYEKIKGYELNRGYISNMFVNQKNRKEFSLDNPYILLADDILDSEDLNAMVSLIGKIYQEGRGLIVISKGFSSEFINCFITNKNINKDLNIALVDYSFLSDHAKEKFEDLAAYINANVYYKSMQLDKITEPELYYKLGICKTIKITENYTYIIEGKSDQERLDERKKSIKYFIEEVKKEANKRNIEKDMIQYNNRLSLLEGNIVKLNIGGNTDMEKDTNKFLIEDAVFSCKSALKYGYTAGGNLAISKIIYKLLEDSKYKEKYEFDLIDNILLKIITSACKKAYKIMILNSSLYEDNEVLEDLIDRNILEESIYNLKRQEIEYDNETDVINSSMTDIMILKSSLSIIGLIATSNQYISNDVIR